MGTFVFHLELIGVQEQIQLAHTDVIMPAQKSQRRHVCARHFSILTITNPFFFIFYYYYSSSHSHTDHSKRKKASVLACSSIGSAKSPHLLRCAVQPCSNLSRFFFYFSASEPYSQSFTTSINLGINQSSYLFITGHPRIFYSSHFTENCQPFSIYLKITYFLSMFSSIK